MSWSAAYGCQMVYFAYQKSKFGNILEGLELKMLVYCLAIWYFYGHFEKFYGH
jgi:hypothetical protein